MSKVCLPNITNKVSLQKLDKNWQILTACMYYPRDFELPGKKIWVRGRQKEEPSGTSQSGQFAEWHRFARWFIFKPKISIWVNFGGPYVHWKMLIYFMVIWNILSTFGISCDHLVRASVHWVLFPVLGSWTKKNLATLECHWNINDT
jgi:hypothetical protein